MPRVSKAAAVETVEKPPKSKRAPTAYSLFVKAHYESVRNLPARERFKAIAAKWRDHKAGNK